jgi:hypothetical protein
MEIEREQAEMIRMLLVLDTNHYNALTEDSSLGRNAQRRIEASGMDIFISIIAVQEITQGWLALINRRKSGRDQVHAYTRFQHSIETLNKLTILLLMMQPPMCLRTCVPNACELAQWT